MAGELGKCIRKEITTRSEYLSSLSYMTDISINLDPSIDVIPNYKFDSTIAYGNGTSYQYPRAMFLGSPYNQVYPPIIRCTLSNIKFENQNNKILTMSMPDRLGEISNNGSHSSQEFQYTYVFPNIFTIKYSKTGNATPASYSTIILPNFTPGTTGKCAYVSGYHMTIMNASSGNYPFFNSYTVFPSPGISYTEDYNSACREYLLTYLDITANETVTDGLFASYGIKNLLAYNKFSTQPTTILRRSFDIGSGTHIYSRCLAHFNQRTFYSAANNAVSYTLQIKHDYQKLSDYSEKWIIQNNGVDYTTDSNIHSCLELPGMILNTFLIYRKDLMDNEPIDERVLFGIRDIQCNHNDKKYTFITRNDILTKGLDIDLDVSNDWHGDHFDGNPILPNWGNDLIYIKNFKDKHSLLYSYMVWGKDRTDQYKPDLMITFNDFISFVNSENENHVAVPETFVGTDIYSLLHTKLFEIYSYSVNTNTNKIDVSIRYAEQDVDIRTLNASTDPGPIKCQLAANIILPFYYDHPNYGECLGLSKALVMSNDVITLTSKTARPANISSNYRSAYVIYFE